MDRYVRLVASMMVGAGELDRYLKITVPALLEFCDELVIRCEGEAEHDYLDALPGVAMFWSEPSFFDHEGRARQELLEHTLIFEPTHVLSIDADEMVADGRALRRACESECPVLTLVMQEIWKADRDRLSIREDGGWRQHPVPVVYRVPGRLDHTWRIPDRQLACGREPIAVQGFHRTRGCSEWSGTEILHFGWTNVAERQARHQRYVTADGGRFHARAHLDSIVWPDSRVRLLNRGWPEPLGPLKTELLARINR